MKSRKIYIILFVLLYAIVAFSSFFHSVEFFELTNQPWMGVILALAFEVGQAAVLLSILTTNERKKITSWILMFILTLVQIIGNVYSSYKYILTNSDENLVFFKEPIFIWTDLPDAQATVIVTYISSAILPLCALLLTAMVSGFINKDESTEEEYEYVEEGDDDSEDDQLLINDKPEVEGDENTTKPDIKNDESTKGERTDESDANQTNTSETERKESIEETENQPKDDESVEPIKEEKSHFVNI